MSNAKKLFVAVTLAALVVGVAGCGKKSSSDTTTTTTAPTTTMAGEPKPSASTRSASSASSVINWRWPVTVPCWITAAAVVGANPPAISSEQIWRRLWSPM